MKKGIFFLPLLCLLLGNCFCGRRAGVGELDLIPVSNGQAWGYINHKGDYVIGPEFESAGCFFDGLARVEVSDTGGNSLYGFIDKKGRFVVKPVFKRASEFSEGIAWTVRENGAPTAVGTRGEELFTLKEGKRVFPFSDGLAKFEDDNSRYGYVNKKGETVVPALFREAGNFSLGKAPVQKEYEDEFGYIDKNGNWAIAPQFGQALPFDENGKAPVRIPGGKWGVIDRKGLFVINPLYSRILYDNGLYWVRDERDRFGWCDENGLLIIPPQYMGAAMFGPGKLACVQIEGKWGYIDRKGRIVIQPQFRGGNPFFEGIALVVPEQGNKYGIIDEKGRYVVNPSFRGVNMSSMAGILVPSMAGLDRYGSGVETDYIDTEKIASELKTNINSVQFYGMRYDEMLSAIMTRFGLTDRDFDYSASSHSVKRGQLCDGIDFVVSVKGNFYKKVSDGWWGYRNELNTLTVPDSYKCSLALSGLPGEKKEWIFTEICKAYEAKKLDSERAVSYRDDFKLRFYLEGSTITIETVPRIPPPPPAPEDRA